jgi:hypothetical protein
MTAAPGHVADADPAALYEVLDLASLAILKAGDGDRQRAAEAYLKASRAAGDAAPLDSDLSRALGTVLEYVGDLATTGAAR